MQCDTQPSLLALPAELRIRIYVYFAATRIAEMLDSGKFSTPRFLQTCVTVRTEASVVYFQELQAAVNTINCQLDQMDKERDEEIEMDKRSQPTGFNWIESIRRNNAIWREWDQRIQKVRNLRVVLRCEQGRELGFGYGRGCSP